MKESICSLLTELCCNIINQTFVNESQDDTLRKRIRSKAFEILLKSNKVMCDDDEDNLAMVVVDISGHIYCSAKRQGQWNWDLKETVDKVTDKLEVLAKFDPVINPVLRLLLCLADNTPSTPQWQEPCYGLDMKTLITDNYEHRSLLKYSTGFNSSIFNLLPALQTSNDSSFNLYKFNEIPGFGLRYQNFFALPTLGSDSLRSGLKDINQHDISNANWIFPKLSPTEHSVNVVSTSRVGIQDEGYVTPDQDLKIEKENYEVDYHWEQMSEEKFKPNYSWESFGSFVKKKELPFIFQERAAADHIWKIIHAFYVNTSLETGSCKPVLLKAVSLEELEAAFRNLLIGVQSTIFHYDPVKKTFVLKEGLHLKGSSAQTLAEYCKDFIECANLFRGLNIAAQEISNSSSPTDYGLIYQVLCSNITCYLQCYRGIVLRMPSLQCLLRTHTWLYKLRTQLQFLVELVRSDSVPRGGALLVHLYNQLPLVTRTDLTFLLYYILQSCTKVYFELLKKWIFEGECHSYQNELFIESCVPEEMDRRFWSRGFTLNKLLVPGFLKDLEGDIFVCGKNMALLKICAPDDPVCVLVKRGYPGVAVCLNKTHVQKTEKLYNEYSDRYKSLCQEMFGNTVTEPCQDEYYYANIRAATLMKIHEAQKEEKKLKNDKKRLEFEFLKKSLDEAETRKKEDKLKLLEEEQKLLKEAKEVDALYKLRVEEERKKLIQYYSTLSEAADRRKERAEWKIKRLQLNDKRVTFLKSDTETFYNNEVVDQEINESQQEMIKISTDHNAELTMVSEASNIQQITSATTVEPPKENICQNIHNSLQKTESNLDLKDDDLDDKKREWLIALDVADQARQSAVKFKHRSMFNEYNILTGESQTLDSRFKDNTVCDDAVTSQEDASSSLESKNNVLSIISTTDSGSLNFVKKDKSQTSVDNSLSITQADEFSEDNQENCNDSLPIVHKIKDRKELYQNESPHSSSTDNFLEIPLDFEKNLNIDEINISSIDQNLRISVMIPLQTQLQMTNEAVLRLLLVKHNLFKHLECIKNYFFLEGEFGRNLTQDLFSEIQTVVKSGQDPSYVLNFPRLNSLLRSSIRTVSDEEYTERLSFFVRKIPSVFRLIDPNMLDCLNIRYKTYWPINIIVTDGTVLKLDIVFRFLIKLHRVSWALENTIYLLKDKRLDGSKQFKEIQLFRHIMSHFVSSLKTYVTTTLEGCWCQFNMDFKKVRTLNEIYDLYMKYINRVHFRCLLNKKAQPMGTHLSNVFGQILRFHEGLRKGVWTADPSSGQFHHSSFRSLVHVYGSFLKEACYLYHYTKPTVQSAYQAQLVQLHSLLSVNDFYDTH